MRHLISFSIYGDKKRYLDGALKNIEIARVHMPDFKLRFYCSQNISTGFFKTLKGFSNVEALLVNEPDDLNGMFWRFSALLNPEGFESIMIRDCDSRLSSREHLAHMEFIQSNKHFHIMKDHPTGHNRKILGGLFSCKGKWGSFIPKLGTYFRHKGQYGADMAFLDTLIYPIIKWDAFVHDASLKTRVPLTSVVRDFPSQKTWQLDMVGAAVDENDEFVYEDDARSSISSIGVNKYLSDWT